MSQRTTKPTKKLQRPAKTQINLRSEQSDQSRRWSHVLSTALGIPKRDEREALPYWLDVQGDLSLSWSHGFYLALSPTLYGRTCMVYIAVVRAVSIYAFSQMILKKSTHNACFVEKCENVKTNG